MSGYNIAVVPNDIGHNICDYPLAAQVVVDNLRYRSPGIKVLGVDMSEVDRKIPEDSDMIMVAGVYSEQHDIMRGKIHKWLKEGKKVVMGGIGLIQAPKLVMRSMTKDLPNLLRQNLIGFRGEAESGYLQEFLGAIINEDGLSEVSGAVYYSDKLRENGLVVADAAELSKVPVTYSDFDLMDDINLETSKGCIGRCSFCDANYSKSKPRRLKSDEYVRKSLENALNRIGELYPGLKPDVQLEIPDLDFIGPPKEQNRASGLFDLFDETFDKYGFGPQKVLINYQSRPWKFSPQLESKIRDMVKKGYKFLVSVGFESMSPNILRLWKKGTTPELNEEIMKKYIDMGFVLSHGGSVLKKSVILSNIIFTDFRMNDLELLEQINGLGNLVQLCDPDYVFKLGSQITQIYADPRPNTLLESELKERGLIKRGCLKYENQLVAVFADFLWGTLDLKVRNKMYHPLLLKMYELSESLTKDPNSNKDSLVERISQATKGLEVNSQEDLKNFEEISSGKLTFGKPNNSILKHLS